MVKPRLVAERDWGGASVPGERGRGVPPVIDAEPAAGPPVRTRESGTRMPRVVSAERVELIRRVVGSSVLESQVKLESLVDTMDSVADQTGRMQKSGIQIGRDIKAMLLTLSAEEGRRVLRSSGDLFPGWSPGNIRKMIGAAEVYDSGWVDRDVLPISYSVLYELSRLDEPSLRRAAERKLISPSLTRTQAGEVHQLVRTDVTNPALPDDPAVSRERQEVEREIDELRAQIRKLMARRAVLLVRERRSTVRARRP